MPSAASLRTSANSPSVALVAFVDRQQEDIAKLRMRVISRIECALDKCRKVLDHSRKTGLPVAFIRMLNESAFFNRATAFVRWIEGSDPDRNEMIFERKRPSCYAGEPFTALVNQRLNQSLNQSLGGIVLAGFAGNSVCETSLCDRPGNHAFDEMPAGDVHRAVSKASGIFAEVFETDDWIEQTLPRNLGYGKNAGG